jgi:hypothetical protein
MKALLILAFVLAVVATALVYGQGGVVEGVTAAGSAAPRPSEPAVLLMSGGALLALASAVRRYMV